MTMQTSDTDRSESTRPSAAAASPRQRRVSLAGLVGVGAVICLACTATGFLGRVWWVFDLTSHFRVQYALALAFATAFLFLAKQRRFATLCALGCGLNAACILPLFLPPPAPPSGPQTRPLRLLLCNVNTRFGDPAKVVRLATETDPDFILLQETSWDWDEQLQPLRQAYPHGARQPRDDNFGIEFLSRLPLGKAKILYTTETGVPSTYVVLEVEGERLIILGTHPLPPAGGDYAAARDAQLANLVQFTQVARTHLLLAGDLNLSPWSPHFSRFLRDSGLRDSARGFGWQPTWPTHNPLFWLPLDHCLHSPGVVVRDRRVGGRVGSDHYPLVVDLVLVKSSLEPLPAGTGTPAATPP